MSRPIPELHAAWLADAAAADRLGKVFVTGVAKSGTTWAMLLLDAHPHAVVSGEGGFAWRLLPALQQGVSAFNGHCKQNGLGEQAEVGVDEFAAVFRQVVLGRLASYVRRAGAGFEGLRVVGDKTPQHTLAMGLLAQVFPDARFVNIVRDPRDTAVSAWHHFGKRSGKTMAQHAAEFIAGPWVVGVRAAVAAGESLGGRVMHVRYEDLHAEPERWVAAVLTHAGLDASAEHTDAVLAAGKFETLSGGRARGQEDRGSFFRKGVVGDWVNELSEAEAARACGPAAELMARFGYATAGSAAAGAA